MAATPRRSVTAVRRWMLWSHDQTLGETTLIATGISNGSAAEYLSMIGSRSLRRLLRDRRWIVLSCDGLDRFLVAESSVSVCGIEDSLTVLFKYSLDFN